LPSIRGHEAPETSASRVSVNPPVAGPSEVIRTAAFPRRPHLRRHRPRRHPESCHPAGAPTSLPPPPPSRPAYSPGIRHIPFPWRVHPDVPSRLDTQRAPRADPWSFRLPSSTRVYERNVMPANARERWIPRRNRAGRSAGGEHETHEPRTGDPSRLSPSPPPPPLCRAHRDQIKGRAPARVGD